MDFTLRKELETQFEEWREEHNAGSSPFNVICFLGAQGFLRKITSHDMLMEGIEILTAKLKNAISLPPEQKGPVIDALRDAYRDLLKLYASKNEIPEVKMGFEAEIDNLLLAFEKGRSSRASTRQNIVDKILVKYGIPNETES